MSMLLRVTMSGAVLTVLLGSSAEAAPLAAKPTAKHASNHTTGNHTTGHHAARHEAGRVSGLDISAYQHAKGPIAWRRLARAGMRFAAVKVSEGTYYANPYYLRDIKAAAAAGLVVMPYVFANPSTDPGGATARYAYRAAHYRRGPRARPLVVDLENNPYDGNDCYGLGVRPMIAWIAGFVNVAQHLTGKRPIIYTTAAWWQECTGSARRFGREPLWLAAYAGTPATPPRPWRHWTFLQYSNTAVVPGIGPADLDYYHPTPQLPLLSPVKRPATRTLIIKLGHNRTSYAGTLHR
jgi:lysozyme